MAGRWNIAVDALSIDTVGLLTIHAISRVCYPRHRLP